MNTSKETAATSTAGATAPTKLNRSLILRAMLMVSLYWFSMYVYIPYTATFLRDLSVNQSMIGLVAGSYGIAQVVLRPPLGIVADLKGSSKPFIVFGVIVPAVASLVRIVSPSGGGFLLANSLSGVGAAMWIVFIIFFADFFGKGSIQQATALIMGANAFGQLLGFTCSALFYNRFGMTFLCWLSVGASVLATFIALSFKNTKSSCAKETSPSASGAMEQKLTIRDLLPVFKNKRLWFFSIMAIMQSGIVLATVTNFDTQRVREFGGSSTLVGLLTITFMICQMISSMVSSTYRFRRHGAKVWLPLCLVAIVIYCFVSPQVSSIPPLFALQILTGFFAGTITSFTVAEATKEIPESMHTTAMGIFQCLIAVGIVIIPMISGRIAEQAGQFAPAYYAIGFAALLVFVLSVWGTRTTKLDAKTPLTTDPTSNNK
ncbi:MAG TPA: MFS transporter [Clostridiaceae bacterium]|nr:MFS transporter [Clostridiaceae bacterium]